MERAAARPERGRRVRRRRHHRRGLRRAPRHRLPRDRTGRVHARHRLGAGARAARGRAARRALDRPLGARAALGAVVRVPLGSRRRRSRSRSIIDLGVQLAVAFAEPGGGPDEAMQAVVQAPLVEETAKGIGVLLIFAFSRSHFDGPVDGLVYAATAAAGFAFTENILYFGAALAEGGGERAGRDLRGARHLLAVRPRAVHRVHRHRDRHRRAPRRRGRRRRLVPARALAARCCCTRSGTARSRSRPTRSGSTSPCRCRSSSARCCSRCFLRRAGGAHHPRPTRRVRRGRLVQPRRGRDARHTRRPTSGAGVGAGADAAAHGRDAQADHGCHAPRVHQAATDDRARRRGARPSTSRRSSRRSPPTGPSSCADGRGARCLPLPFGATPRTRKLAALWCGTADISTGRRVLGFQSA